MPEEEASVTPYTCRQVAGQHELANHTLLTAQLLWLVKGKHLVCGGILLDIIIYAVDSTNHELSSDLVESAARGYCHQVCIYGLLVVIGEGDVPSRVEPQPVGEVGTCHFCPVLSSLAPVSDSDLKDGGGCIFYRFCLIDCLTQF